MLETVLSRGSSSALDPANGLSATQAEADQIVSGFLDQASDWKNLAALSAGSVAYRLGRVASLSFSEKPLLALPLKFLSYGVGLSAEVSAYEISHRLLETFSGDLSNPNRWKWAGKGGLAQGLGLSAVTFSTLKGASSLSEGQNVVLQHLFSDMAMVGGHQLGSALGFIPAPEGGLPEQLLHAEATYLQLQAGMGIHYLLSPRLLAAEKAWDLKIRSRERPFSTFLSDLSPSPLFAMAANPVSGKGFGKEGARMSADDNFSYNVGVTGEVEGGKQAWIEQYRPFFPDSGPHIYSEEIIAETRDIPFPKPEFYPRLMEGFYRSPQRGTREQYYQLYVIHNVFTYDATKNAMGSFDNALLQHLFTQVLSNESAGERNEALQAIFQAMEGGLSRRKVMDLIETYGTNDDFEATDKIRFPYYFAGTHTALIREQWNGYSPEEKVMLANFIYEKAGEDPSKAARMIQIMGEARNSGRYPADKIHGVLDLALKHPLGKIIVERLFHLFMVQDIPAKLNEFASTPLNDDTLKEVMKMEREGKKPEEIAQAIDGTVHTAYLKDPRLARKLVSVLSEAKDYLLNPDLKSANLQALKRSATAFLRSGRPLDGNAIVELLEAFPNSTVRSLARQMKSEKPLFTIEVLSEEDFDEEVFMWGEAPHCRLSLFQKFADPNRPDRILIREMPKFDIKPDEPISPYAYFELSVRLYTTLHEFEHWRHFTGAFDGEEKGAEALEMAAIGREERHVSEMMALLEEMRWRAFYHDNDLWEITQRQGSSLGGLLRNLTDMGYYQHVNARLGEWLQP
ncbi:MAG: hypothetical protein U1F57_04855 [bacterium]